jgi:EmrB/QacA subfamily drug resistance transporter
MAAQDKAVHPYVVLATCCMSLFVVTMDVTIINVALPAIARDLHSDIAGLQWSIDGYTVVIASFLMLSGSIADRVGRRRTFRVGLALFALGSLACSFAPSIQALVVCRMLQAVGGTMLNPIAMSIIVNTFIDPKARARAIGVWGGVVGISMAAGPLLGGLLTQSIGWRSIFWINVPIAIVAIILTTKYVPESRAPKLRRLDPVGQALVVVALFTLTSALIEGRHAGWTSPLILTGLATAAAAIGGFVVYERRRAEPLIDLRFFRSLPFLGAVATAVLTFICFAGFLFLGSLYLQQTRELGARDTGFALIPVALAMLVCSPISGRLVAADRARLALVTGGCALIVGASLLVGLAPDTPLPQVLVAFATVGIGMGSVNAPITNTAVSGMPRAQAGVAAGVASTSRQVGASLGVALAGTIAGGGARAHDLAFAAATRPFWWLVLAAGICIVGLGFASTGPRAKASAARVAPLLDPT